MISKMALAPFKIKAWQANCLVLVFGVGGGIITPAWKQPYYTSWELYLAIHLVRYSDDTHQRLLLPLAQRAQAVAPRRNNRPASEYYICVGPQERHLDSFKINAPYLPLWIPYIDSQCLQCYWLWFSLSNSECNAGYAVSMQLAFLLK